MPPTLSGTVDVTLSSVNATVPVAAPSLEFAGELTPRGCAVTVTGSP